MLFGFMEASWEEPRFVARRSGVDSPLAVRPWTCKDFSFLHPLKNEGVGPVVFWVGGDLPTLLLVVGMTYC